MKLIEDNTQIRPQLRNYITIFQNRLFIEGRVWLSLNLGFKIVIQQRINLQRK